MSEVIQIKEFEPITCETEDKLGYGKHRMSTRDFKELYSFIRDYSSEDNKTDILELMKISYKRNVGDIISLKNYVGIIQLPSGLKIEILPKIDFGNDLDNIKETKRIFLKMLRSMQDFDGKVFTDANLDIDHMNMYEIFINMYLQETRRLVKKGLKSDYIRQEDNLKYYRGKLLVNEHIKLNLVHKEKFYVGYDEFCVNRAENRLIKSTLIKLQKLTQSNENSKEIYRLLTYFEMVEPSNNLYKDFSSIVADRNMKDYGLLMQWSRVFLMNQSFTTFSGSQYSKAILFPMESVYESYVARMMNKVMTPLGWDVHMQHKGKYLFDLPQKKFAICPDLVLNRHNRCVILDTKWKALTDKPSLNYGISQGDMYQMYAYSKKFKTSEIWLLYPMNNEFRGHQPIWYKESGEDSILTNVNLFFIDFTEKDIFFRLADIINSNKDMQYA